MKLKKWNKIFLGILIDVKLFEKENQDNIETQFIIMLILGGDRQEMWMVVIKLEIGYCQDCNFCFEW